MTSGYSRSMRGLHWATAGFIAAVYVLAFSIEDASSAEHARLLTTVHRSLGAAVLMLTLGRVAWRTRSVVPSLPADLSRLQVFAAHANVAALYALLLVQPVLGLCASWLHGDRLVLFGLVVPSPLPLDRPWSRRLFDLHHEFGWLLLALIAMHIGAALFHHFIRRDGVLAGMVRGGGPIDKDATVKTHG